MGDPTGEPLDGLAMQLGQRGRRTEVYRGTLGAWPGARGERAVLVLGQIVRWA